MLGMACMMTIISCAPSTETGSEPGHTMNGTYIDDSASAGQHTQDTISRDINKDWNRVK